MVIRDIDFEGGANINGELLTYLRFADDIVFSAETTDQLQVRLTWAEQSKFGLMINWIKTKFMHF